MPVYPDDVRYTAEHEWARRSGEVVRVGITAFAQDALGDIVFVSLPAVGAQVKAGEPMGEVESTKSVSDIYAPVTGQVVARNEVLDTTPELINSDPYGDGWLVELASDDTSTYDGLMDASSYAARVDEH
jgi:glycine cleavage system H protein